MSHSRRVLEAEKRRGGIPNGHSADNSHGYLKHSRAFPNVSSTHSTPNRGHSRHDQNNSSNNNNNNSAAASDGDYTDTDCFDSSNNNDSNNNNSSNNNTMNGNIDRGWSRHSSYPRMNNQTSQKRQQVRSSGLSRTESASTSSSPQLSPSTKKSRMEVSTAPVHDGNSGVKRNTGSLGVRQGLLALQRKQNRNTRDGLAAGVPPQRNIPVASAVSTTAAISQYAAPFMNTSYTGALSPLPRVENRLAAPTSSVRQKECPSQQFSTLSIGAKLDSTVIRRTVHDPVTAGISPVKRNRSMFVTRAEVREDCSQDSPIPKRVPEGEEKKNKMHTSPVSSYSYIPYVRTTTTTTTTTTTNAISDTNSAGLPVLFSNAVDPSIKATSTATVTPPARFIPSGSSTPVYPRVRATGVSATPPSPPQPISPPLRAAVPTRLGMYRQYRPQSESPQSTTRTPPSCGETVKYISPNWMSLPSAPADTASSNRNTWPSVALPPVGELSNEWTITDTSKVQQPRRPQKFSSRMSNRYVTWDRSGFMNSGNDCYACSVLTLLLRSVVFRRGLFAAMASSEDTSREGSGEGNSNNRNSRNNISNTTNSTTESPRWTMLAGQPRTHTYGTGISSISGSSSIHGILCHFARLLQKPEDIVCGLDMTPLKSSFCNNFFSGDQEDAHEFFLALMQRLEEEFRDALRTKDRMKNRRTSSYIYSHNNSSGSTEDGHVVSAATELEAGKLFEDGDINGEISDENQTVIDPQRIWVNTLMHGKLLNIIRCKNKDCGYEIATEDLYMNLSINVLKMETTESISMLARTSATPESPNAGVLPISHTADIVHVEGKQETSPVVKEYNDSELNLERGTDTPTDCYDVQTLLEQSLRFDALEDYVCDACGSSQHQHQGGCLLGNAPPLLVIHIKRFTTVHSAETGVYMLKDSTRVCVNEELTLYALQEEGQYDREKKQLSVSVRQAEWAARQQELKELNEKTTAGNVRTASYEENPKGTTHASMKYQSKEDDTLAEVDTMVKAIRNRYQLRGVLSHLGTSPFSGHYITDFLAPSEELPDAERSSNAFVSEGGDPSVGAWCHADDITVRVFRDGVMQSRLRRSSNCYLLLYEKVEEEEVMCPVSNVLPREMECTA